MAEEAAEGKVTRTGQGKEFRGKRAGSRDHYDLKLGGPVRDRLLVIQGMIGADNIGQVLRNALALYEFLIQHEKRGAKIIVRESENGVDVENEVILWPEPDEPDQKS